MSRTKGGLISRIRQAIEGRQRATKSRYQRRNFLRLESLEARAMLTGAPPTALPDGPYSTDEDQELIVLAANGVLANDTDEEGDPLVAVLVDDVDNGALTLNDDGSFVYTPNINFVGTDSFTYRAFDGTGESNDITVTIEVTPVNDAPVAVDDAYSMAPDATLIVDVANGVLANDSDVDDDPSVLSAVQVGSAVNGTVTVNPDGSFTFTPTPGFSGIASFQYEVSDDDGATSNTATVTITVNAPPEVSDITDQTVTEGETLADLPFTVGDDLTDADSLVITATSDNQSLIPDSSITLGGSGANRTITLVPEPGQVGSATITITVTDANGASTVETFLVTVNASTGTDPTISDIPDQTFNEGDSIPDIAFTVGDAETDPNDLTVTFEVDNEDLFPSGSIVLGGSGESRTISLTPAAGQTGSATITVRVTDADGNFAVDTFLVTINPAVVGTPPTISDIPDQTIDEDTATAAIPFTIDDAETDPNDLTVTFETDNEDLFPSGSIVLGGSGDSRTITLTPAANQSGSATITVRVTDSDGNSVTDSFLVTVNPVNDAPTLSTIADQTTPFNTPIVDLPLEVGDVDDDLDSLILTASSDNPSLIPDANIVFGGTGANRTVTITPVAGESGTANITITVEDADGLTSEITFQVTVSPNTAPTISDVADQTTDEDQPIVEIPVTVGDAETPADDLVVTASSDNPSLIPNDAIVVTGTGADRKVTITPAPNQFGTATITLTVSDGYTTTVDTFVVTVTAVNDLPTLGDVADQTVVENDSITNLEVTVGDVETPVDDLVLTATSDNTTLIPNENIVISTTGGVRTISITPAADQTGTAVITLRLEDGEDFVIKTFTVTVAANTPPTISEIVDQTTAEDTPLTGIEFTIGDAETADGDLVVTASSSNTTLFPPGSITLGGSGANRTILLNPAANEFGTATITITVTDAHGGETTETFVVTVTAVNDPPVIDAIANQTVAMDDAIVDLPITIGDIETDAAALTLTGSSSNTALIPNSNIVFGGSGANRTVTITPAPGQVGTATITVTVTDADGGTATRTFQVTVTGSNSPPTITPISDQTTDEDTPLTGIAFTVGDAETPEGDLVVTATSSNTDLIPNSAITISGEDAERTITITPAANQSGTATITILVDDGNGGTVTETFVVTVNAVNDLPTITSIADQTINEDTSTAGLAVTIGDVETPVDELVLTASSSNTDLIPNENIAIIGSGANRTIVVTPAPNQSGSATITLTVTDADGGTTTETFVVTVNPVNDPPVAVNDTYTTTEDTTLTISNPSAGVLANDSDPENEALTTVLVLAPNSGQLVLNADGTFTYTPALNFTGSVTFQYRARDASGALSEIATVTINVTGVNDPPTATADGYTVATGNTLTVSAANGVLANDADPDAGTTLTAVLVSSTSNGTLTLNADGSFTYVPNPGFTGTDSFTYRASDGELQSDPVTVTIAVSATPNMGEPIIVGPTSGVRAQTLTFLLSVTGGTADNVTYSIDWNGDGTVDQTITGPGTGVAVTHVFGTSGTYNVRVQTGSSSEAAVLPVSITDFQRNGNAFVVGGTSGNDTILVQQVRGGIRVLVNGVVVGGVQSGLKTVEVLGGDGNDNIVMAGNLTITGILRGGAGNDRLVGARGSDFLFGDEGDDLLFGGAGSDFLSGGDGNDVLNGGADHDVLFGGDGSDTLIGGSHYNLLIAGTTDFDFDFKAQKAILHAWAAGGTFEHRMSRLNFMSKGGLKLVENSSVRRDGDVDRVVSTGSADWIFAALGDADQVTGRRKGRIVSG